MKFENIKNVPCIGVTTTTTAATESSECSDPEYASFAGEDVCTNAPKIDLLVVTPSSGVTISEGGLASFQALLQFKYTDGSTKKKNVTELAKWSVQDAGVASKGSVKGEFKGHAVTEATSTKVTARYTPRATFDGVVITGDVVTASASLTVNDSCVDNATEIVLVVDRSGSMKRVDDDNAGETRLDGAKRACRALICNSQLPQPEGSTTDPCSGEKIVTSPANPKGEFDRIAVVSYAGDENGAATHIHCGLVATRTEALGATDSIEISEECGGEGKQYGCYTGIGGGIKVAYELLQGKIDGYEGARSTDPRTAWPRKLIVVLTDGYENVCDPDPEEISTTIKADRLGEGTETLAHDTMIAVVGFTLDSTATLKRCNQQSMTVGSYLKSLANCYTNQNTSGANEATALTFFPQTNQDLVTTFSDARRIICEDNARGSGGNGACNYIGVTDFYSVPKKHLKDRLNFNQFTYWNVCKNTVDLMGINLWNKSQVDEGTYVGLIGNRGYKAVQDFKQAQNLADHAAYPGKVCQKIIAPYDHNFGGIETKDPIALVNNVQYMLTVKVSGNLSVGKASFPHGLEVGSSIRITVGGTQAGTLLPNGADFKGWARYPDDTGTMSDGFGLDGIPRLVTRDIVDSKFEKVYTISPETSGKEIAIPLQGDGKSYTIRIEQFPHDYGVAYKVDEVFNDGKVAEIFGPHGCGDIKGESLIDPLSLDDFSGFIAEGKTVGGRVLIYPLTDQQADYRYQGSGKDHVLHNTPFGINVLEVTLKAGTTNSSDVFVPSSTTFEDKFESEIGTP